VEGEGRGCKKKASTYKVHLRRMDQLLFRILTRRRICRGRRRGSSQLELLLINKTFEGGPQKQGGEKKREGGRWSCLRCDVPGDSVPANTWVTSMLPMRKQTGSERQAGPRHAEAPDERDRSDQIKTRPERLSRAKRVWVWTGEYFSRADAGGYGGKDSACGYDEACARSFRGKEEEKRAWGAGHDREKEREGWSRRGAG